MILLLLWLQSLYVYWAAPLYNLWIRDAQLAYNAQQYDEAAENARKAYGTIAEADVYIFCLLSYHHARAWNEIEELPLPSSAAVYSQKEWAYIYLIKGVAAYENGHEDLAVKHFKQSLLAYPLPDAAYNLELLLNKKKKTPVPQTSTEQRKRTPQISNIQQILQSIQNNEQHHMQRKKGKQQNTENIEW